jgi:antitoxin (DNA-binding transcriptional repressor) of toxin-antitoxin stability system
MYMSVSATDFRKNMFQLMERTLQGEPMELVYKGRVMRLSADQSVSKLDRLTKQPILNGTPEEVEQSLRDLKDQTVRDWDEKWSTR